MLLTPSQGNIVEKILRDKGGRLCRATFCVYENAGRVKARLVSVEYIDEAPKIQNKSYSLTGFVSKLSKVYSEGFFPKTFQSPYFNNNLLYSLGLKPRAPTL